MHQTQQKLLAQVGTSRSILHDVCTANDNISNARSSVSDGRISFSSLLLTN